MATVGLSYFLVQEFGSSQLPEEFVQKTTDNPTAPQNTETSPTAPQDPSSLPGPSYTPQPTEPSQTSGSLNAPIPPQNTPPSPPYTPNPPPVVSQPPEPPPESLKPLTRTYQRELVRVNHSRNCVLCHPPSFERTDLIRATVPDPNQELPPPLTQEYYELGSQFVTATTTYLRQDFSVVQPVPNPGKWPSYQRYDYFVALRKVDTPPATGPSAHSPYRNAVEFALRELSGRDPKIDRTWLNEQKKKATPLPDTQLADVAQTISLQTNPKALLYLKDQEFAKPLLTLTPEELTATIQDMQEKYTPAATRLALIAYLAPLTNTGDESPRRKAVRLLEVATSTTPDTQLPAALAKAATSNSPVSQPSNSNPTTTDADNSPESPSEYDNSQPIATLTKRLDKRSSEELEKQLLGIRELDLDQTGRETTTSLIRLAKQQADKRENYHGPLVICDKRPELAGLPFRIGHQATLRKDKAEALHATSRVMRQVVASAIQPDDPRPNTERLRAVLLRSNDRSGRFFHLDVDKLKTAEAVPCIQQMLCAENRDIRQLACEMLRRIASVESTEALVRWAVFDTEAEIRTAAIEALRVRREHPVAEQLLQYMRYPLPQAVEHAAEALVALNCREVIPQLAVMYDLPDPDAPFRVLNVSYSYLGLVTPTLERMSSSIAAESTKAIDAMKTMRAYYLGLVTSTLERMSSSIAAESTKAIDAMKTMREAEKAALEQLLATARNANALAPTQLAEKLAPFLTHPDLELRRKAVQALADLGGEAEPAANALRHALNDPDPLVQYYTMPGKLSMQSLAKPNNRPRKSGEPSSPWPMV
jgi:HEAT repeat protein